MWPFDWTHFVTGTCRLWTIHFPLLTEDPSTFRMPSLSPLPSYCSTCLSWSYPFTYKSHRLWLVPRENKLRTLEACKMPLRLLKLLFWFTWKSLFSPHQDKKFCSHIQRYRLMTSYGIAIVVLVAIREARHWQVLC